MSAMGERQGEPRFCRQQPAGRPQPSQGPARTQAALGQLQCAEHPQESAEGAVWKPES